MSRNKRPNKRVYPNFVESYEVVDGDTFKLLLDLGHGGFAKVSTRMLGYDTPEKVTTVGKKITIVVIRWCRDVLLNPSNRLLWVSEEKSDKYGRSLGHMLAVGLETNEDGFPIPFASLQTMLIVNKLAKPYSGEGKRGWSKQELDLAEQYADRLLMLDTLI